MVKIPEHIKKLSAYKAGKPIDELAREKGLTRIIKLASNENPFGPSPLAVKRIAEVVNDLHRYVDPAGYRITHAIANHLSITADKVICASGSDALIQYIISTFSEEDDELLSSEGTFIGWYVNVNKYNRKSVTVALKDYAYDLNAILSAITEKTKIIYLANPNNPTGTIFSKNDFEKFMSKVPPQILVILDEAYTVYAKSNPDYPDGLEYDFENLLVLRTFSKAYGLAGLRIGFCGGNPDLIKALYKVRLPFEPNFLAQEAAIASLSDSEFLEMTIETNEESLEQLKKFFDSVGIEYVESSANFLLSLFEDESLALEFTTGCLEQGLILRHVASFGIPNGVRINSGTIAETAFAIDIMRSVVEKNLRLIKESSNIHN